MNKKSLESWSPWILLVLSILVWEGLCRAFNVSEFVFPSPSRIAQQTIEYRDVIAGHAWRTYWVTMVGFGIAIVVGVLLGFIIGSSRLAYAAVYPLMTAFNALAQSGLCAHLGGVVRHRHRPRHLDGLPHQLLSHHGEHRHRLGHAGA